MYVLEQEIYKNKNKKNKQSKTKKNTYIISQTNAYLLMLIILG
jgi:hypothetical protein